MGRYWKRQKTLIVAYVEVHILHLFLPKRISVLFHSLPFYYAAKYLRESWPWVAIIPSLYHLKHWNKNEHATQFRPNTFEGEFAGGFRKKFSLFYERVLKATFFFSWLWSFAVVVFISSETILLHPEEWDGAEKTVGEPNQNHWIMPPPKFTLPLNFQLWKTIVSLTFNPFWASYYLWLRTW